MRRVGARNKKINGGLQQKVWLLQYEDRGRMVNERITIKSFICREEDFEMNLNLIKNYEDYALWKL